MHVRGLLGSRLGGPVRLPVLAATCTCWEEGVDMRVEPPGRSHDQLSEIHVTGKRPGWRTALQDAESSPAKLPHREQQDGGA